MVVYASIIPIKYHIVCFNHKLLNSDDNSFWDEYIEMILIINNKNIGIRILSSTLYLDIFFKLSLPY